jgi:hypothetical protein
MGGSKLVLTPHQQYRKYITVFTFKNPKTYLVHYSVYIQEPQNIFGTIVYMSTTQSVCSGKCGALLLNVLSELWSITVHCEPTCEGHERRTAKSLEMLCHNAAQIRPSGSIFTCGALFRDGGGAMTLRGWRGGWGWEGRRGVTRDTNTKQKLQMTTVQSNGQTRLTRESLKDRCLNEWMFGIAKKWGCTGL